MTEINTLDKQKQNSFQALSSQCRTLSNLLFHSKRYLAEVVCLVARNFKSDVDHRQDYAFPTADDSRPPKREVMV